MNRAKWLLEKRNKYAVVTGKHRLDAIYWKAELTSLFAQLYLNSGVVSL